MKFNKAQIAGIVLCASSVAGLMLLAPQAAKATGQYTTEIAYQLARIATSFGFSSRNMTHEPKIDTLSNRETDVISLNLRSGITYGLIGVCDSDCADVDLKLYDQNYRLVDTDTGFDDTPVVRATPRWTGTFYLEVNMANCRAGYCYYGVGVFGR